jgi:hypothetical protein|tara:strand:- start:12684 stop:13169 length:486 start_codon:yes stop_codon:yes gene_type:complete
MLGTGQLQHREPLETEARHGSHVDTGMTYRRNDDQCLALVKSLAGDMPLRLAAAHPDDCPNVSAATMRLRRFVRFYPSFAGAALFDNDGKLLANADFRAPSDAHVDSDLFRDGSMTAAPGITEDAGLAQAVSTFGSDTLLHVSVGCPQSDKSCGVLVTRLR